MKLDVFFQPGMGSTWVPVPAVPFSAPGFLSRFVMSGVGVRAAAGTVLSDAQGEGDDRGQQGPPGTDGDD